MNTVTLVEAYNKLKDLRVRIERGDADVFVIMEEAQEVIAGNSEVGEIFEEEFEFQLKNSLDQHPFESHLHIETDLMSLIHAINKKHRFN